MNSAMDRLHARQARVRQQIKESQQRLASMASQARGPHSQLGEAVTWLDRARMIYRGVRVGLRVATLVKAFWPRKKHKRR